MPKKKRYDYRICRRGKLSWIRLGWDGIHIENRDGFERGEG
jgi:hypothetical protein